MNKAKIVSADGSPARKSISCSLSTFCCGFLLARGIARGAQCAGWDMPALTGSVGGSLWGAALFGIACAAGCLVRREYGRRAAALSDLLTAVLYCIHALMSADGHAGLPALADCAAVLTALLMLQNGCPVIIRLAVPVLSAAAACACALLTSDPLTTLRLGTLTGGLSAAGVCGAALTYFSDGDAGTDSVCLAIGAAAGMI